MGDMIKDHFYARKSAIGRSCSAPNFSITSLLLFNA